MHHAVPLLESAERAIAAGEAVALCAVVGAAGSTPQEAGALMLLHADTRTEGTLGGGCVEAEVRRQALGLLMRGESRLLSFKLDHDYGWDDGLICGGRLEVAVMPLASPQQAALRTVVARLREFRDAVLAVRVQETDAQGELEYQVRFEPVARLLIAGGGHVGHELARQAANLDFRVRVFDDRADVLTPLRFPPPIERIIGPIEELLAAEPIDENTYVVIVTRGHRHDEQALHAVMEKPARYMGMIGSRRKTKLIFDDLRRLGIGEEHLARVHSPIGLPIGAVTVPEIAISILAQLIERRRKFALRKRVEGPVRVGNGERCGQSLTPSAAAEPV